MERIPSKSQHTKITLEKKILQPLQPGFELVTFRLQVRRSGAGIACWYIIIIVILLLKNVYIWHEQINVLSTLLSVVTQHDCRQTVSIFSIQFSSVQSLTEDGRFSRDPLPVYFRETTVCGWQDVTVKFNRGWDSSVGREPDSWSKGCEFEFRQERQEKILLKS